ncbi:MAG: hypothetical protein Q4A42_02855 [Tissierellia bacterium]|nr:hypothetical protein [Tissierellia bacterium]
MENKRKRVAVYNKEADKKYRENNKEHRNYLSYRGTARSFIRNFATEDDLEELKELIAIKEQELLKDINN